MGYPRLRLAFFRENIPRIFSLSEKMVPEGGFEPPTRGFSIRCSTPELLGPPPKAWVFVKRNCLRSAAYRERLPPLASAKSVFVTTIHAIFIFRRRSRHFIALPQPLQQVTILASATAKGCVFRNRGLFAQGTFTGFNAGRHGHGHSLLHSRREAKLYRLQARNAVPRFPPARI
jgi:hypothetical protein